MCSIDRHYDGGQLRRVLGTNCDAQHKSRIERAFKLPSVQDDILLEGLSRLTRVPHTIDDTPAEGLDSIEHVVLLGEAASDDMMNAALNPTLKMHSEDVGRA